jgi:protein-disulfide isomerase
LKIRASFPASCFVLAVCVLGGALACPAQIQPSQSSSSGTAKPNPLPAAPPPASSPASAPAGAAAAPAPAVTPEQEKLLKSSESFIRNLFAWGPEFKIKLGPLAPSDAPDFYLLPLQVTLNGQTDAGVFYVSKDGKTFIRGDMYDTSADPFADNRSKIHLDNNPSMGPADAKVVVVEFSDFECPHCRELYRILKTIEPQYPQVRIVFKDFPIAQIHPWAETAALAARCAYMQKPDAFWLMYSNIFDDQDVISTENVWEKLNGYAAAAGLDVAAFKTCQSSPEAMKAVEANMTEGHLVSVVSTPTVFVNGRPLVGGDPGSLRQFIDYELRAKGVTPPPPPAASK